MRSAFLVAHHPCLADEVRTALQQMGAHTEPDGESSRLIDDEGRMFSVEYHLNPEFDWEYREGPFVLKGSGPHPDMATITACYIECRWEQMFVDLVAAIAARLSTPSWVLDGDGVIWPADNIDPTGICL